MRAQMRYTILLAMFGVMASLARADDKSDATKADRAKFQGTWKFVSMEQDGKKVLPDEAGQTITFDGDKFAVKVGGQIVQAGTQKLDATKKPKTVDATVSEGQGKGTTMLGIYAFDGETMRACFDAEGKKRPTEFKAPAGSGHFLVTVKREKK